MPSGEADALEWTVRIVGVAIFLQTLELLSIRKTATERGIWSWKLLREDFDFLPTWARRCLDALLSYPGLLCLFVLRLISATVVLAIPHPALLLVLLVTTILIAIRWRGTFNGGSDTMTIVLLSACFVATAFDEYPTVTVGCLLYISLQACSSYFIAGLAKISRKSWRSGRALPSFLHSVPYAPRGERRATRELGYGSVALSWGVMAFEFSFPLALLSPGVCSVYVAVALIFHVAVFFGFGLNRFVWAWAGAYPALYYASRFVALGAS